MEHYDLNLLKIFAIIKFKIYFFENHLVEDVLGAPWCARHDSH